MKTKTVAWLGGLGMGLAMAACSFMSCSEPPTECQVGLSAFSLGYVGVFTPMSVPACAASDPALTQPGDTFGMEFYNPPAPGSTIVDGGLSEGTYSTTIVTMAIVSDTMANEEILYSDKMYPDGVVPNAPAGTAPDPIFFSDGVAGHEPYAYGTFTAATPDGKDFCYVGMNQPAQEDFAYMDGGAVTDAGTPALTPTALGETWSGLTFYVTAAVQGDQFKGQLTRTINGCSVTYSVVGLWPAVNCTLLDPNTGAPILDKNGNPQPSLQACSPCADPSIGMAIGSGINPNFPIQCSALYDANDPFGRGAAPYYCVLTGHGDATNNSATNPIPQLNSEEPACANASNEN